LFFRSNSPPPFTARIHRVRQSPFFAPSRYPRTRFFFPFASARHRGRQYPAAPVSWLTRLSSKLADGRFPFYFPRRSFSPPPSRCGFSWTPFPNPTAARVPLSPFLSCYPSRSHFLYHYADDYGDFFSKLFSLTVLFLFLLTAQ